MWCEYFSFFSLKISFSCVCWAGKKKRRLNRTFSFNFFFSLEIDLCVPFFSLYGKDNNNRRKKHIFFCSHNNRFNARMLSCCSVLLLVASLKRSWCVGCILTQTPTKWIRSEVLLLFLLSFRLNKGTPFKRDARKKNYWIRSMNRALHFYLGFWIVSRNFIHSISSEKWKRRMNESSWKNKFK